MEHMTQYSPSDTIAWHAIVCKLDKNGCACGNSFYARYCHFRSIRADRAAVSRDFCGRSHLDLECGASQTRIMAHSYIRFDFGMDEEKAQQARHKLDGWKQAFRLDKKLLYKLDRPESTAAEAAAKPEAVEKPAPGAKSKAKTKDKSGEASVEKSGPAANGKVGLL